MNTTRNTDTETKGKTMDTNQSLIIANATVKRLKRALTLANTGLDCTGNPWNETRMGLSIERHRYNRAIALDAARDTLRRLESGEPRGWNW
jgi:hypothetical protein